MRPLFFVGLCLVVLAGRAEAQSSQDAAWEKAQAKIGADVAKCQDRRSAGEFATHREAAQCINEAVRRGMSSTDYPYRDLVELVNAYRIACAQKMDAGELTEDSCVTRMGELKKRVLSEETRRNQATGKAPGDVQPAAGPRTADFAALLNGLADWSKGGPGGAAQAQIVCFRSGPTISCR
jgi:hypothetical protein